MAAVAAGIDRQGVSMDQEYPYPRPGAGGGGLAAGRADQAPKIRIWLWFGKEFHIGADGTSVP